MTSTQFSYTREDNWAKLPSSMKFGIMTGVTADQSGNVYVGQQRQNPPILVFNKNGDYVTGWGSEVIDEVHILTIGTDGFLYAPDRGAHMVHKFDLEGNLIFSIGERRNPSDTGSWKNWELKMTVERSAGPFNMPTRMFPSPTGSIYVSDGYRNCRIHEFDSKGTLLNSWGEPGKTDLGLFHLPHSLWITSDGTMYVCDRKNNRVQVMSATGDFLSEWTDLDMPGDICMDPQGNFYLLEGDVTRDPKISIRDKNGNLLHTIDAPYGHQLWVTPNGDVYLAVCWEQQIIRFRRT